MLLFAREEPRVLYRYDSLRSKALDEFDLPVGEGTNFPTIDGDHADQLALPEHRHDQKRPRTSDLRDRLIRIFRGDIGNVGDFLRVGHAIQKTCEARRGNGVTLLFGRPRPWRVVKSDVPEQFILVKEKITEARFAKLHGIFQYRFKYRLQFAR